MPAWFVASSSSVPVPTFLIRTGRAQGQTDRKEKGLGGGLDIDAVVGLTEFKFTLHGAQQKRASVWKAILSQRQSTSWRLSCREGRVAERKETFSPCPMQQDSEGKANRCEAEKKKASLARYQ